MSERYGVALTAIGDRVLEYGWCVGSDHKQFVGTRDEAQTYASAINEKLPGNRYEVRPYPSPEAKPAPLTPSAVDYSVISPATIAAYQRDQTLLLAFALFASDPAVEAFVTARAENADRYEATLRIAFDRDENGWATHARNRAARVIARMAK